MKNKKPPRVFPERSKKRQQKTAAALYKKVSQRGTIALQSLVIAIRVDQNGVLEIQSQDGHEAFSVDLLIFSQGDIKGLLRGKIHKLLNIGKGMDENCELFHTKSLRHCTNQKTSFIMLLWKMLSATDYSRLFVFFN